MQASEHCVLIRVSFFTIQLANKKSIVQTLYIGRNDFFLSFFEIVKVCSGPNLYFFCSLTFFIKFSSVPLLKGSKLYYRTEKCKGNEERD